jgi:hypothetical protein
MQQEKINAIMLKISLYGRLGETCTAQDAIAAISDIRHDIEQLVENPSVTPMWHMIEDKDATYMIVNTVAGIAYCKGMDEDEAWKLVRRLNGIEE